MSLDYGARLQLQKIVMLAAADIVVVNKSDLAGAKTALSEVEQRLAQNRRGQKLIATIAKHPASGTTVSGNKIAPSPHRKRRCSILYPARMGSRLFCRLA